MRNGFLLLLLLIAKVGASEVSKEDIAKEIYFGAEILDVKEHSLSMAQMILARQPGWGKHRELIIDRASKILSSDSYQHSVAEVISKNFSRKELLQLQEIMKTPVMLKWFKKMPQFLPEVTMVTTNHVMPAINELITEIQVSENYLSNNAQVKKTRKTFEELFRARNCAGVHAQADKILHEEPKSIHALYSKGYCYQMENSPESSLKYFELVFDINPKYRHVNLNLANAYLMLNNNEKAIEFATQDVNLYPQSSDSFQMLAKAYGYIGNKEESLKAFDISLRLNPNNVSALYDQAFLLFKNGEKYESCQILKKAAEIEPAISKLPIKIEACGA